MLKKLAKRITKEIHQANDYMEQAYLVKSVNSSLADLFAMLSEEELVHAEKLIREGQRIIDSDASSLYSSKTDKAESTDSWKEKCKIIWEWEHRLAMEEISECRYKLTKYKGA